VGEVGGAGVRPLRRQQRRGRRARRRAAPRILQVGCSGRSAFREGHTVGEWRCIVAFDPAAAHAMPHRVRTIDHIGWETDAALCFDDSQKCPFSVSNCSFLREIAQFRLESLLS
jgi:hypothetical protein